MPSWLSVELMPEEWLLSEEERLTSLDAEPMLSVSLPTEDVCTLREELMPRELLLIEEEWLTEDVWLLSEEERLTSLDAEPMPREWPLTEDVFLPQEEPMLDVLPLTAEEWPPPIEEEELLTSEGEELMLREWPLTDVECTLPEEELTERECLPSDADVPISETST